jgi:predicted outer membrane repeat protein
VTPHRKPFQVVFDSSVCAGYGGAIAVTVVKHLWLPAAIFAVGLVAVVVIDVFRCRHLAKAEAARYVELDEMIAKANHLACDALRRAKTVEQVPTLSPPLSLALLAQRVQDGDFGAFREMWEALYGRPVDYSRPINELAEEIGVALNAQYGASS